MPQETNLNVAPYFDDFDSENDYYKVLFKPGFPVQARELTTLQSILQNQVESVGDHLFKEGAMVIPGGLSYQKNFYAIQIDSDYLGIPVTLYLDQLIGKTITGATSGITARVVKYITSSQSERGNCTLYIDYIDSSSTDLSSSTFLDNEVLLTNESINYATTFISAGEGFAKAISQDASAVGSAMFINDGIYFLRGYFVNISSQTLILDQYNNNPSYRIGFNIVEQIISSDVDESLNDNAKGFNNYTAPGADRLKITATLSKKSSDDYNDQNFVQLAEVKNGVLRDIVTNTEYNIIAEEFARRTFDESGNYYVKEFVTKVVDSLNNGFSNRGLFNANQLTPSGNVPSNDIGIYKISPGKAYVKGFEVETISPTLIDFEKPRTTRTLEDQGINFGFGPSFVVNSVNGCPSVGINTSYTISMRDDRVGTSYTVAAGKEIGIARLYDFNLKSGSYDSTYPALNKWNISLWDISKYSDITVNESVSLTIPTYIEGRTSGATGYLRHAVVGTAITAYDVEGEFIEGERLLFNGVEDNSRSTREVTNYKISDFQSMHGIVGSGQTFSANFIPSTRLTFGNASITAASGGISTVTAPNADFLGVVETGNLLGYQRASLDFQSFAKVESVSQTQITISGITTVSGFVDGALPSTAIEVNDLSLLGTTFQQTSPSGNTSSNNTLYSSFPKQNISNVSLNDATLIIRRPYDVTITDGSTATITANENEVFLPYTQKRYTLILDDGTTEILSSSKLTFGSGSTNLTVNGLSGSGAAQLVTTIRKDKIFEKVKVNNTSKSIVINKSSQSNSGVGATTLNDGLTYGNYAFGTRVQDSKISLNVPDVVRVFGVFESKTTSDPESPNMTTSLMSGSTSTTNDLIISEQIVGSTSGALAKYIFRKSDSSINFIYENQNTFQNGEVVTFTSSGVTAVVSDLSIGSNNITSRFTLDRGQKETYYDYSKIIRNKDVISPTKKIIVYYESASYDSSDTGDITTVNSYDNFDYSTEIGSTKSGIRCSDIVDARLRTSDFTVAENTRSPFEFFGRSFTGGQHSSKDILASDESITVDYSYYLPRYDRILINKKGEFVVKQGIPSDIPTLPVIENGAMEIANVFLPAYLHRVSNARISFINHKRYQMQDISKLERRINNLEYYTSLNILEQKTINQFTPDENGLNRFKSGIAVDNFHSRDIQDPRVGVKNAIDKSNHILRPSHYTTAINLNLATEGNSNDDTRFSTIIGDGIRRTNQVISLDYSEVSWLNQPFATRAESVTPFLVTFYQGQLSFEPTVDVWIDTITIEPRNVEGGIITTDIEPINVEVDVNLEDAPRIGALPTVINDNGEVPFAGTPTLEDLAFDAVSRRDVVDTETTTWRQGTPEEFEAIHGRAWWGPGDVPNNFMVEVGTTIDEIVVEPTPDRTVQVGFEEVITEGEVTTESLGNRIVKREIIANMRTRNIEFTAKRMKPYTRVYPFFDEVDVSRFCINKLIEIQMVSGTFQVGETVRSNTTAAIQIVPGAGFGLPEMTFRVASSNHKSGPYNNPDDVYVNNPYDRNNTIPANYSETSSILNVDTFSLADEGFPEYSGYLMNGMTLQGETSGAIATVSNLRLVTDEVGSLIGCYRVPDSRNTSFPVFSTGRNKMRLTSSPINSKVEGTSSYTTAAEEIFYSQGDLDTTQEVTLSTRNVIREQIPIFETIPGTPGETVPGDPGLTGRFFDPLAQSFTIDDETGVFVSSCDVFFESVPTDNIPVAFDIREMELGVPSKKILAYSRVVKNPQEITTSSDGSVATKFTFESPVYLEPGREYAIVLLANSPGYTVWISRLGEIEVSTINQPESSQTLVSTQPLLGSLFKSQNASTWTPSQYEDMKFELFRCDFVSNGNVQLFNPDLSKDLEFIGRDSVTTDPYTIRVGLGTTVVNSDLSNLEAGNTVTQTGTDATGDFVGFAGSATSSLTVTNAGVGYTPSSGSFVFNNVSLTTVTGNGINATANVTVNNGSVSSATIVNGGVGYRVGDVVTPTSLGTLTLGTGIRLSISEIYGENELIITNVQGEFGTLASNTLTYVNSSGITTTLNYEASFGNGIAPVSPIRVDTDGLHLKIFCRNHGMHSETNLVTLSDITGDTDPTPLTAPYGITNTSSISVTDSSDFTEFENVSVASTNPGYVKIGSEIISYTGTDGNTLTGITRGIDSTLVGSYSNNDLVYKYELNGVSLRRINKTHELNEVTISDPITLDSYHVKIDMSENGTDRSSSSDFPDLHFNEKFEGGGVNGKSTYNIQFEKIKPNINTITPTGTSISATSRTVSGTSVSGSEISFVDKGTEPMSINKVTMFDSPRIIASKINETTFLTEFPQNKSFTTNFNLSTEDSRITPIVDLNNSSIVFTTNRVNQATTDYINDFDVKGVRSDKNSFYYVTKNIRLGNPGTSIELYIDAYIHNQADVRAFYALDPKDDVLDTIFTPFPGYDNLEPNGAVTNTNLNDGTTNVEVSKVDSLIPFSMRSQYKEYKFSVDRLTSFNSLRIKLIGTSTNQAFPPMIKNLRVISYA
jgi:hypothetical protein